jgi:hypothetical protein
VRSCWAIVERFIQEFGDGPIDQVTPEYILTFLNRLTYSNEPYTKRIRYSHLSSFFNFVRNNINPDVRNPCDTLMIRKLYRERVAHIHSFSSFLVIDDPFRVNGMLGSHLWNSMGRKPGKPMPERPQKPLFGITRMQDAPFEGYLFLMLLDGVRFGSQAGAINLPLRYHACPTVMYM